MRHPTRDSLASKLRVAGIQVGLHYSRAAHQHAALEDLPAHTRPVELPQSEAWAAEELSLPMFAELSEAELQRIAFACRLVCGWLERHGDDMRESSRSALLQQRDVSAQLTGNSANA